MQSYDQITLPDDKLHLCNREELIAEVVRLRNEIRYHESQEGDSRCWLDDERLYERTIPNYQPRLRRLPPKEEFLANCSQFHACRQEPFGCVDDIYEDWEKDKPY